MKSAVPPALHPCLPEGNLNDRPTLLYADDDEAVRLPTCELLRYEGYEVLSAPDAASALALVRERPCDCLIADIHMPGNAKLEFIAQLAQERPGLPVILVTGNPAVETATAALKLPVAAYLMKPVDANELLKEIREVLSRSALLRQVEKMHESLDFWLADLNRLSQTLRQSPRLPLDVPMDVFVTVTYRNVLEAMAGLQMVLGYSLARKSGTEPLPGNAPTPLLLVDALRETIAVLEKTKDSFRSRDLGELRRKLERLLETENGLARS
jgi:DNA-binding response OmpR family regulator